MTAETDPRIARAAQGHRGHRYASRAPSRPELQWTAETAYAFGLLATDGCLSPDGRHVIFVSKDRSLVETFLRCLGRDLSQIRACRSGTGAIAYRVQLGDVALYRWLLDRGLRPAKSLTLGGLEVPSEYLVHLLRGLLDGDGSVLLFRHRPTVRAAPAYWYLRLWTYFHSASPTHIEWLAAAIETAFGLSGSIARTARPGRHPVYRLKFGNAASAILLNALYADPDWPSLARKRQKWCDYIALNVVGAEGGI